MLIETIRLLSDTIDPFVLRVQLGPHSSTQRLEPLCYVHNLIQVIIQLVFKRIILLVRLELVPRALVLALLELCGGKRE